MWLSLTRIPVRWNANQPNATLLSQSAMLYAGFYGLQICVHRPFIISRSGQTSSLYQPSVAIVTSASRMVSQILDGVRRREIMPGTSLISSAFSAGWVVISLFLPLFPTFYPRLHAIGRGFSTGVRVVCGVNANTSSVE